MKKFKMALAAVGVLALAGCSVIVQNYFQSKTFKRIELGEGIIAVDRFEHASNAFTEGYFLYNDCLYESSGRYGMSFLYRQNDPMDISKGSLSSALPEDVFAEGMVGLDDSLYLLTYQEHKAYHVNPDTFTLNESFAYPREGWGLTTDGEFLIASDGSSELFYMDKDFQTIKTVQVKENEVPVDQINELEWVNGYIVANLWQKLDLIIIQPETGEVVKRIDCRNLYADMSKTDKAQFKKVQYDVLNGIAYDEKTNLLYVTGKYWSYVYALQFSI